MNAALHADNRHIADVAEDKTARVARNSGNREAFDIVVIEGCGNADIIRKSPRPEPRISATSGWKSIWERKLSYHFISFS